MFYSKAKENNTPVRTRGVTVVKAHSPMAVAVPSELLASIGNNYDAKIATLTLKLNAIPKASTHRRLASKNAIISSIRKMKNRKSAEKSRNTKALYIAGLKKEHENLTEKNKQLCAENEIQKAEIARMTKLLKVEMEEVEVEEVEVEEDHFLSEPGPYA